MDSLENKIRGNWNLLRGKFQQKYGHLTHDDLKYEKGKEVELIGRLQKRTGMSQNELKNYVNTFV
ncbi:CsbD family protein [Membranihabitans maritimus]|uniref:CsbD family protein n=1 Tax=Membranihabitans maritimus TaxID=2904244 RepID=UPI001F20C4D2|nr:CsbD family protein [Membranihabitans maritimus]